MERLAVSCNFSQPSCSGRLSGSCARMAFRSSLDGRVWLPRAVQDDDWRHSQRPLIPSREFASNVKFSSFRPMAPWSVATSHQPAEDVFVCSAVSSAAKSTEDASGLEENLSARERRKLRNERREKHIASQGESWREVVENRILQKKGKKKIKGWQEEADIDLCISKGVRWWMVQTAKKREAEVAEQISLIFEQDFPGREYEVLVPTVPIRAKLKDGEVSVARKKLYEGIVLLRCLLDRELHLQVKKIRRAYDFFGTFAGSSIQPIIMPAPVANINMENMFEIIRKEEEKYEKFKEQCRVENEELRRDTERIEREKQQAEQQQERIRSKRLVLEVGASVRVLSGPFVEFTGKVVELLPEVNKIRAVVTVFGNETKMLLDVKDVVVEAAGP